MIAQALAVLHPGQVRRLVLCATFPGVGTVIPPQAKINDLTNGNGLSVLFPADQADGGGRVRGRGPELRRRRGGVGRRDLGPGRRRALLVPRHRRGRAEDLGDLRADARRRRRRGPARRRVQLAGHRPAHPRGEAGALPRRRARVPVPGGDAVRGHGRVVPVGSGAAGQHGRDPGGVPGRGGGGHRGRRDVGIPAQGAVSAARLVRDRRRPVPPARPRLRSTRSTSRSPAPSPPSTPGCCRPGPPGRSGMRSRRS